MKDRFRAWRVRRAQRRILAYVQTLDARMVEARWTRAERRRVWREIAARTKALSDVYGIEGGRG